MLNSCQVGIRCKLQLNNITKVYGYKGKIVAVAVLTNNKTTQTTLDQWHNALNENCSIYNRMVCQEHSIQYKESLNSLKQKDE